MNNFLYSILILISQTFQRWIKQVNKNVRLYWNQSSLRRGGGLSQLQHASACTTTPNGAIERRLRFYLSLCGWWSTNYRGGGGLWQWLTAAFIQAEFDRSLPQLSYLGWGVRNRWGDRDKVYTLIKANTTQTPGRFALRLTATMSLCKGSSNRADRATCTHNHTVGRRPLEPYTYDVLSIFWFF